METIIPSNAEVQEIAALVARQLLLQERLEKANKVVKDLTEDLRQVQEVDLPNAMAQAGVQAITLPTGEKISVKNDVAASMPKDERYPEALDWLMTNGYADVIKNEFKVNFGKGEEKSAQTFSEQLRVMGLLSKSSQHVSVHPATLKSLIKERMEAGKDVPMEMFGVFPVTKAIIK